MPDVRILENAIAALQQYRAALDVVPNVINVQAGASLQLALDRAPEGAAVSVEPATFEGPIRITKPVTLFSSVTLPPGRVKRTSMPASRITSSDQTLGVRGPGVTVRDFWIDSTNGQQDVVDLTDSDGAAFDRCLVLGDPLKGAHRGVLAHGVRTRLSRCYVDDCFRFGAEAMAVGCYDGTYDLGIYDCYLAGGAMAFMAGGGDATSPDRIPRLIRIDACTLSKNPAWYAMHVQTKNAFELKAAIDVQLTNSILEYAGTYEGQGGFPIVLTPRNQDGRTPWSTVRQVLIENVVARYAAGGVQFLGADDLQQSDVLSDVTIRNVLFDAIDPRQAFGGVVPGGRGRIFEFSNLPRKVTLQDITANGRNLGAIGYFTGAAPGLTLRNIRAPLDTSWDWKIDAGGMGLNDVQALNPDAAIANVSSRFRSAPQPVGADLSKLPQVA